MLIGCLGPDQIRRGGVNFFLADVQSGLGPFLGVYLLTKPGWNAASIGLILTIDDVPITTDSGLLGLVLSR
jgi:hypothetical protein